MKINCSECNAERETKATQRGKPRLPKGWKAHGSGSLCNVCWAKRFILRAITVPVAFPLERKSKELWMALGKSWAQTTQLANWAVTQLAKNDVVRTAEDKKMPAMPQTYLYPEARKLWPDLNPRSVVSVLHSVESRYRRRRLEALWRSAESLPRYRYPMPYPTHNQAWRLERMNQGMVVTMQMAGETWRLRLRGGHAFYRQVQSLEKIIAGSAVQGEFVLYRQRANAGDRRSDGQQREEGGERGSWRIMAKIVAWLPRDNGVPKASPERSVTLKTAEDRFWIASIQGRDEWVLNADHVRGWIAGHDTARRRLAEDRKPEMPRRYALKELRLKTSKHHHRIKSFCQMSVSAFVKWCKRAGVTAVGYDDTNKKYFQSFPWEQLRTDLANKLDEVGIELEVIAAGEKEEATTAEAEIDATEESSDEAAG